MWHERTVSCAAAIRSAAALRQTIGSTKPGSSFLTFPTRALTGQRTMPSDGVGGQDRLELRLFRRLLAEPCRPGLGRENDRHAVMQRRA